MEGDNLQEIPNSLKQQVLNNILHGISGVDIYNSTPPKNDPASGKIISEDQVAINRILENSPKR